MVCPRVEVQAPGEHSRGSRDDERAPPPPPLPPQDGGEAAPPGAAVAGAEAGPGSEVVGKGVEGEGVAVQSSDAPPLFFLAFYSALQEGGTVLQALRAGEAAQPQLAGVYGVHGMHDGMLLLLP